ncbi:hypothetical protein KJ785_00665 [Patescibacteria group bacterium]|nr:hypothetical protein [Patescibacteria group bacterium]
MRKLAIHACTDQPLLSLVIQYSGVSAELRSAALQNSGDKKLLRRLVVGHFDRDLKYRAADRLCQFDKDWLGENVVRDMGADRFLRVQLMTNCFEGDNEVLGRVFGNKDEEDEIRVAALLGMAGYLERPFATTGYTDNLLMIAMDKTESSLVQSTALMIYSDKVAVQKVLSQIKREALYGVDN